MTGPVIIIGAGAAGAHAALALREFGHDGEIVLIGDEAQLPYERPPLSKFDAATGMDRPIAIFPGNRFAGIDVMIGRRVVSVQPEKRCVMTDDGGEIAYGKLLLATGAQPRRIAPSGEGILAHYLRTADDAKRIRQAIGPGKRLAIIGGGLVGLELAASARACGAEVVVLERQPGVLGRGVPLRISALLAARHQAEGVEIRCDATIAAMRWVGEGSRIALAGGEEIVADAVVAGIGAEPDTRLAESAGIDCHDGIRVDECMRTSIPDIYAAGDCCNASLPVYNFRSARLENWRAAQDQGRAAAAAMLGLASSPTVPWFWSDHYDLGLQVAGLFAFAHVLVERQVEGRTLVFGLDDGGRLVAAAGLGTGTSVAREVKLCEKLIAAEARPDPIKLADPDESLKTLLRSNP